MSIIISFFSFPFILACIFQKDPLLLFTGTVTFWKSDFRSSKKKEKNGAPLTDEGPLLL